MLQAAGFAQQAKIDELAKQMDVSRGALLGFFKILKDDEVLLEQLATKLALVAQRHNDLLDRLGALEPEDDEARALIEQAREVIRNASSSADYDRADDLLFQAEEAQDKTILGAEALEREAHEAARRLRLSKASTRAERGELSLTRLDYLQAARHFRAAAEFVGAEDSSIKLQYFLQSANALQSHGDEKGDNATLMEAIAAYRELLGQCPRERVPLDWAMTQNNLGTALDTLGARENGVLRLEEAVSAYRAALEEYTRERVPLQWAMTQNNLGTALRTLGERESGVSRLEEAVSAYSAALEELTRERVPLDWATTQNNLGAALQMLGERESSVSRLEEAVSAYRAALEERTRERVPLQWAMTQNNLGAALRMLGGARERCVAVRRVGVSVSGGAGGAYPRACAVGLGDDAEQSGQRALDAGGARERRVAVGRGGFGVPCRAGGVHPRACAVAVGDDAEQSGQRAHDAWGAGEWRIAFGRGGVGVSRRVGGVHPRACAVRLGDDAKQSGQRAPDAGAARKRCVALGGSGGGVSCRAGGAYPRACAVAVGSDAEQSGQRAHDAWGARERRVAVGRGVSAYRAALEERTRERVPLDRAMTQNNLGTALRTLGERESGVSRLEEAVAAIQSAWSVYREAGMGQYDGYFEGRVAEIEELIEKRSGGAD